MQESGLLTRRGGYGDHCCLTSEGLPGHSDWCRVASKAEPGPLGGYFASLLLRSNCPPNGWLISHGSVVDRGQLRGSRLGLPRACWGTWSAGLDEQVGPSHSWQLQGAEDGGSAGAADHEVVTAPRGWGFSRDGTRVLRARAPQSQVGSAWLHRTQLGGPRKSPPPRPSGLAGTWAAWKEGRRTW